MFTQDKQKTPVGVFEDVWCQSTIRTMASNDGLFNVFQDYIHGDYKKICHLDIGSHEMMLSPSNGKRLIIRRIAHDDYVFCYHRKGSVEVVLLASLHNHGKFNAPLSTKDVYDILLGDDILMGYCQPA